MKTRMIPTLAFFLLCTTFATAGTVYENGSVSGDYASWRFDHQGWVSDTFTVSGGNSTIDGLSIWVLIFMTDHNPGAEVVISSQVNGGGNVYFDRQVQFSTESNCYANYWGYNECQETANWTNGPTLPDGTYWITLKNGTIPSGADFGWDQNSGFGCQSAGCPSQAQIDQLGTIPSEAFTILGTPGGTKQPSPKTTSLLTFGTGFLGLVTIIRRKLV
jgi:hypothetical protein